MWAHRVEVPHAVRRHEVGRKPLIAFLLPLGRRVVRGVDAGDPRDVRASARNTGLLLDTCTRQGSGVVRLGETRARPRAHQPGEEFQLEGISPFPPNLGLSMQWLQVPQSAASEQPRQAPHLTFLLTSTFSPSHMLSSMSRRCGLLLPRSAPLSFPPRLPVTRAAFATYHGISLQSTEKAPRCFVGSVLF